MRLAITGTQTTLRGTLDIPVSKYHAHRALVLAALADGTSVIHGVSRTRQVEWTVGVLRALGATIEVEADRYVVTGTGGHFHAAPGTFAGSEGQAGELYVGSSGTTLYFMTGLAALADRPMTLSGMKYFQRRPIRALLDALAEMGVSHTSDAGRPPITVLPKRPDGGEVAIAGTLSQWISGLLLLAPSAERETIVKVTGERLNERPYVDLTVRMMRHFGYEIDASADGMTYRIPPNQVARATEYTIPPDIGSAAFGIAVAALHPCDVLLRGLSATRAAETDHPEADFLDLAAAMGVPMVRDEATGWVRIRHDGLVLRPIDVDCTEIPDLLPVLAAMAAVADGTSVFRNVGHVRLKESDRVAAMLQVGELGAAASQTPTELRITGAHGPLTPAALASYNDHRVLMALAVLATRGAGRSTLTYPRAYRISYPEFLDAMTSIGAEMEVDASPDAEVVRIPQVPAPEIAVGPAHVPPPSGLETEPLVLPWKVRAMAVARPEETAVVELTPHGPVETSWRDLVREADRVSTLLLQLGVVPGEAVAVQLPNWREFVAVSLGIMQIGAVVTPIMTVFGRRETAMVLQRSQARVIVLPDAFRGRAPAVDLVRGAAEVAGQGGALAVEHVVVIQTAQRLDPDAEITTAPHQLAGGDPGGEGWEWHNYYSALAAMEPDPDHLVTLMPGPDAVCQLLFTSGTTGEPKGVQHPYRTLGIATSMEVEHLGLTTSDRVFVPSPLAHQTGFLYGMLLAWRLGVACVVQPVWDAAQALRDGFGTAGATFVQCATPFLTDLVSLVEDGEPQPETLKIFVVTGAAVPRELARRATDVLGTTVLGAFGTTETCLGALSAPQDPPDLAWGTDGRALRGIDLRIVDDEGNVMPPGTEGNFELCSSTMFGGYLERPDLTREVFTADGWYRTGDLATLDADGYLRITGRVKDVINRGGEKVPVVEIENLLFAHKAIADVAIVAMPDPRLGERACAFLVAAPGADRLDLREVREYLKAQGVSTYYWPERLEYTDALPRNVVGKIRKNVLREIAATLSVES